jgi:hypothetical protein
LVRTVWFTVACLLGVVGGVGGVTGQAAG